MSLARDIMEVTRAFAESNPRLCERIIRALQRQAGMYVPLTSAERMAKHRMKSDDKCDEVSDENVTPDVTESPPPEVSPPLNPPLPSPPPVERKRRSPSGPYQEFIAWFNERFEAATGAKYAWPKKDFALVAGLLERMAPEELRARTEEMFRRSPAIPFEHPDVGTLTAHINKLVPAAKKVTAQTSIYQRLTAPRE